ncbi:MAG: hypothetical protein HY049_06595 [Acidobacteria bacterium]|nr:hypothetical protein [Acidobacteriota bacterium]
MRERRTSRAVRPLAVLALCLLALPGGAPAQSKDWWDLHDDARKVIENDKATDAQLEAARRTLLAAVKEKDAEGNLPTYNPSVRTDYLPYFYLGWASMRLRRYDDAARYFKKSSDLGFISKGAPADLKRKFDNFQQLASSLKPAADALTAARTNTFASQCVASTDSASGGRIKDSMAKIDAMLSSPSDAAALKGLVDALNGSVGDCVKELGGRRIAALVRDLQAARDDVPTEGLADLLAPETQKDLDGAMAGGRDAEAKGDEDGLKSATARFKSLPSKIARDVDARSAPLAQEADRLAQGNERALNEQNQLGARLADAAAKIRSVRASGKTGKDLIAAAKSVADLKSLVATARTTVTPLLQARGTALAAARRDFEGWSSGHACEIAAVGARAGADAAAKDADAARQGESVDALDGAIARLNALRPDVEAKMKDVLPRKQQEAKSVIANADGVLANLPDPAKKTKGESLKQGVEQGVSKGDVCGLDAAISQLGEWVRTVAPELDRQRKAAIARNQGALDDGNRLLGGFGGILKAETVAALKARVDALAGLVNSSYDASAMDGAGQLVRTAADRARGEIRGQIQEGLVSLRSLRSAPGWGDVAASRRQWLEQNEGAVDRAASDMSSPDLLARFAREYPRARLEIALASAFASLYDRGDAAAAVKTLEDLGPGLRTASASLNYSLSYFYWWQGQSASQGDRDGLMARAKAAYDAGKALRVDLAGMGAALFAPTFVEEMSRR